MNLDLLQSLTKQSDDMGSFGAGYSAGPGESPCRPRREGGSLAFVARNPVKCNSRATVSDSPDEKRLCHPPKYFVRKVVVRSHHNPRLFMTKGTLQAVEMRWPGCQNSLLSDAFRCTATGRRSCHRIRKWLTGNPARHHPETITKSYTRI
jgi:hypothetical protein